MFPYEWLDSYEKSQPSNHSYVGRVSYEEVYSRLRPTITRDKYERFVKLFKANGCTTMGDSLRVYNAADVPFIEAFKKMAKQYYLDKIDACKDKLVSQAYQ